MSLCRKCQTELAAVGRPAKFKKEFIEKARRLASSGLTEKQIANVFSVSARTVYEWKRRLPEFAAALARGKEESDEEVEQSLRKSATGYDYVDEIVHKDADGNVKSKKQIKKHMPPNPSAAKVWLYNRNSADWSDKRDVKLSSDEEKPVKFIVNFVKPRGAGGELSENLSELKND